jgi:hypothetical protein
LPVDTTEFGTKSLSPSPPLRGSGKLRKAPHLDQLLPEPSEPDKDRAKQEKKAKKEREKVEKEREKVEKERERQEKLAAKEKEKGKKAKDAQDRGRTSSSAEDEDKKKGFMRFRLKSRERKTAEHGHIPAPEDTVPSLPTFPKEPAILPIADKFTRDIDIASLSEPPRDSQSTSGLDADSYLRARVRGSRYDRPHPAWRTSFTVGLSNHGHGLDKEEPDSVLPPEVFALPPGQTPEDRFRRPSQPTVDDSFQEVQPSVDSEIIRQYYGLPLPTPAHVETWVHERSPSPTFANLTPVAQRSLQQALTLSTTNLPPKGSSPRSSPTRATHSDLSPYIVPPPGSTQHALNMQASSKQPIASVAKRGGIHFVAPPPLKVGLPLPRRANDPNNPPPTPPPTTGLPPTPPEADGRLLLPSQPAHVPSPRSPGRANSPYERAGVMLSTRATSPSFRPSSPSMRVPSPISRPSSPLRPPGTAAGTGGSQRGRASPFPTKPVGTGNYLLNRRVDASIPSTPLRTAKEAFTDTRVFEGRLSEDYEDLVVRVHAGLEDPQQANLAPLSRRETRIHRSTHAGGYESDGADTESRHSFDTYYGRNTLYARDGDAQFSFLDEREREEAMRHMPMSVGDIQRAGLDDIEHEREQGRERLVRLLVAQGAKNRI